MHENSYHISILLKIIGVMVILVLIISITDLDVVGINLMLKLDILF